MFYNVVQLRTALVVTPNRRAGPADRAVTDQRRRGTFIDDQRVRRLSPLGWDHINLTGDYVWSEAAAYDADGLRPLNSEPEPIAA
jgi:hypothetical protein